MTVAEKRKALYKHCKSTQCADCALSGRETCTCGHGYMFNNTPDEDGHYMTDAEIIGAYEMVFGSTATEELTCKLDATNLSSGFTIYGLNKIKNISINFKEEK